MQLSLSLFCCACLCTASRSPPVRRRLRGPHPRAVRAHQGGRSSRESVVPLVQTRSTRTTVQGEALVLGVLTYAVKLQLENKFTQGELHVVVVPEQPRACLLSHPTHSWAGSCSACSALLVGVDFKLNDAYASARGARGSCSACSTFFTCRQHRPGAARFRCSWSSYKQGCRSGGWGVAASAASHARY